MPKYLGLARDAHDWSAMTEAELERVMQRYMDWDEQVRASGRTVEGGQIGEASVVLRAGTGPIDGPYAESKEHLGGFAIIEAADFDEAVQVFGTHPQLEFGSIEVRPYEEL